MNSRELLEWANDTRKEASAARERLHAESGGGPRDDDYKVHQSERDVPFLYIAAMATALVELSEHVRGYTKPGVKR